jgi:hypothetical protein
MFVVRGKSGKVVGKYATRAEAERRIHQLKAGAARLRPFAFGRGARSPSTKGDWETGAHSHGANDLILFADNTGTLYPEKKRIIELSKMPNGSRALFFHDKGVYSTKPFDGREKDQYGRIRTLPVHATSGSPTRGRGKPFVVHTKSGKIAGSYATKAEAEARIRQLKANAERLKAYRFGKR